MNNYTDDELLNLSKEIAKNVIWIINPNYDISIDKGYLFSKVCNKILETIKNKLN